MKRLSSNEDIVIQVWGEVFHISAVLPQHAACEVWIREGLYRFYTRNAAESSQTVAVLPVLEELYEGQDELDV